MYNLTFDNPYNRNIVRKLNNFRNKQQGYFIPTYIEPEHITHQYDPITITGGGYSSGGSSVSNNGSSRFTSDLFEPRYTLNKNHMVGNRLKGGDSDFKHPSFYNSGTSFDKKDNSINDLGTVHSKRRAKNGMVSGGIKKKEGGGLPLSKPALDQSATKDVLETFKRIKTGGKKKEEKKEDKGTSKLLKIFN